ncbi:MAG: sigma-70 family RNA polymerase sigma factor [Phycisphaerales bacterium]|nr:sigma-70 family RNA polymerase sigma factor [Phycisphaerales bacterium]
MPVEDADAYLVEGVRQGDAEAWREVIARYQGRMLSFARRMLAERSEAEDIVQEAFLGLLRSLSNYDPERSLETYLFAILRNKLHDHMRGRQRGKRQSLDQLDMEDAPAEWLDPNTPSRYVARQEKVDAQRSILVTGLRAWVEQCTSQRRFQDLIVIEMLVVLGMRNKEVAADLEITEPAVAGIKFRVLEQWRKLTAAAGGHDLGEADVAEDSTLGRIWQEEGVSCLKRSTLGRYLLGVLDEEWNSFIEFHVRVADCDRCHANLEDLRREDQEDAAGREALRARCFASSVGFLSARE